MPFLMWPGNFRVLHDSRIVKRFGDAILNRRPASELILNTVQMLENYGRAKSTSAMFFCVLADWAGHLRQHISTKNCGGAKHPRESAAIHRRFAREKAPQSQGPTWATKTGETPHPPKQPKRLQRSTAIQGVKRAQRWRDLFSGREQFCDSHEKIAIRRCDMHRREPRTP